MMKRRNTKDRFLAAACSILSFFYTSGLVYIFFFARRRWVPLPARTVHWVPFNEKLDYVRTYALHTHPENLEFYKDLFGNILLFVPFPFLLAYLLGSGN